MSVITMSVTWLSVLYLAFIIKHFLADFLFQTNWMALGKEQKQGWFAPLAAHAGCHAVLTLAITVIIVPALWWLSLVDFVIHGSIDRCKGLAVRRFGLTEKHAPWWWLLGFDQALHQLTHFAFILAILES